MSQHFCRSVGSKADGAEDQYEMMHERCESYGRRDMKSSPLLESVRSISVDTKMGVEPQLIIHSHLCSELIFGQLSLPVQCGSFFQNPEYYRHLPSKHLLM